MSSLYENKEVSKILEHINTDQKLICVNEGAWNFYIIFIFL